MKKYVVTRCKKCNSENIQQQITAMVDINTLCAADPWRQLNPIYEDYYWCVECEDECDVVEKEEV